mmetsp:Transcript_25899/g.45934  ORF Transcript_25899/g.45934 Transcript_25899/m.45934 type:complete len:219 (-) Transcript_25899:129-785(-)
MPQSLTLHLGSHLLAPLPSLRPVAPFAKLGANFASCQQLPNGAPSLRVEVAAENRRRARSVDAQAFRLLCNSLQGLVRLPQPPVCRRPCSQVAVHHEDGGSGIWTLPRSQTGNERAILVLRSDALEALAEPKGRRPHATRLVVQVHVVSRFREELEVLGKRRFRTLLETDCVRSRAQELRSKQRLARRPRGLVSWVPIVLVDPPAISTIRQQYVVTET